jgi:hypothetical protein
MPAWVRFLIEALRCRCAVSDATFQKLEHAVVRLEALAK